MNSVELAKSEVSRTMQQTATAKGTEIHALKATLDAGEVTKKLADGYGFTKASKTFL